MKKTLLFQLIISVCLINVNAQPKQTDKKMSLQKPDKTVLSVTYEGFFQKVQEIKKREKEIMRLDIGVHSSQYVSPELEWIKAQGKDYRPNDPNAPVNPYTSRGYGAMRNMVFKNTPKHGYQYFIHDPGWITCRDKTDGLFSWELLPGDSIVCQYPCKKARTTFRGRTWIVWYTLDLPYSDGPWKFCGLPGLVLYAWESEGYFRFKCIGIEKGDGHEIKLRTPKRGMMDVYTPQRVAELMMLEKWDMFAFHEAINPLSGKMLGYRDPSGKFYRRGEVPSRTALLYEKFPGINMKKKYPPKKKPATKKRRRR